MNVKDIKSITLEEANSFYKKLGLAFIVKDGEIKGFTK